MADLAAPTAASIAAEVSGRYGVTASPDVVQICPACTFATTTPVWDGRKLVYPDHVARKAQHKKAIWAGAAQARASAVDPAIRVRRDAVTRLHGMGLCVRQIAEALDISYPTSLADHRHCQLVPNAYVTSAMTQRALRAARIAQLHGEGWTVKRIAALLGVNEDTVRDLAFKHHGLRFTRRVAKLRERQAPVVRVSATVARQAVLRGLMAAGVPVCDWAARCGVSVHTIRGDMSRMGLPWGSARALRIVPGDFADYQALRLAERDARRVEVKRLTHLGLMPTAIAAMLGVTPRTVAVDKLALGLTPAAVQALPDHRRDRRAA